MQTPTITTEKQAVCLQLLKAADEPMTAAQIAAGLHLDGSRETQRRCVRGLIKQLRDEGSHVIATLQAGYWLTDDEQLWRDYLDGRQIDAKKILGETHRRKRMLADSEGQGLLFMQTEVCGCATRRVG